MIRLRARFDGRVLIPEEPVDLPAGQLLELQVEPAAAAAARPGDPAAILDAMRRPPHLTAEDVDELERQIEAC